MDRNAVIEYLGSDWEKVNSYIAESLRTDVRLLEGTNNHIIAHSGKMLRPMVSLLCGRLCNEGKATDDCLRYAAASELLHNATLLHDDVADQSDTRRGAPTTRSILGPSASVLVGDFWLASSVRLVMDTKRRDNVVELLSKTLVDLAEGEMLQLDKANKADTTLEDYLRIIYCKTSSLFEASCKGAAYAVEASQDYANAAGEFGKALGLAFQIKDDILDYQGDDTLGKPVGADLAERKITLPLLGAIKGSPREQEIRSMVREIPLHPEYIEQVHKFVLESDGLKYAEKVLDTYISKACEALQLLPDCKEKDFLYAIAQYNSCRIV